MKAFSPVILLMAAMLLPSAALCLPATGEEASPVLPEILAPSNDASETPVLDAMVGEFSGLEPDVAISHLEDLAAQALRMDRPDIYARLMAAAVDPHWTGMSGARSALNMIGWIPDTAENLDARLLAVRYAIRSGGISGLAADRLWRDLRVRAERVGDPEMLLSLSAAMLECSETGMALETLERSWPAPTSRLSAFYLLLTKLDTPAPQVEALATALQELEDIAEPAKLDMPMQARAWAKLGHRDKALFAVRQSQDQSQRLSVLMELLADEVEAPSTPNLEEPPASREPVAQE